MRLLEFNQAENGPDAQQGVHVAVQIKDLHGTTHTRQPVSTSKTSARVFPIKDNALRTPVQRGPIDLEMLQQRVTTLEQRIRNRESGNTTATTGNELDQLRQRLLKLERNINNELWTARQREHTMLEMLAKPPLTARIRLHLARIKTHNLPAIGLWIKEAALEWFQDRQPDWWPRLAQAWQESLDKARGMPQQ